MSSTPKNHTPTQSLPTLGREGREKRPHKVLAVALSGIGNLLMQSAALQTLKRTRPDWKLTVWVAPRGTKELIAGMPYVDEVLEMPYRGSVRDHAQRVLRLRRERFDVGLVLSPGQLIKSAAYLWLAGIPTRIGHQYPWWGRDRSWFLTASVAEKAGIHDIEQNLALLPLLARDSTVPTAPDYAFTLPSQAEAAAQAVIERLPGRDFIALHVGSASAFAWKRWPAARFAALAERLIQRYGVQVLLVQGEAEETDVREVAASLGSRASVITEPLLTVVGLLARCRAVVSNDSGIMHLAAAVGTPTFGLFGPTDERLTGPRGSRSFVVRAPGTRAVYDTEQRFDLGSDAHPSLTALTVDRVFDAVTRHL